MFILFGVKGPVALLAKHNPIALLSLVFSAYVRPVKVAFLSFGEGIDPAVFTHMGFTESISYPMVNGSIRDTRLPEIMGRVSIGEAVTFLRTVLSRTFIGTKKLIATHQTHLRNSIYLVLYKACVRTECIFLHIARSLLGNSSTMLTGSLDSTSSGDDAASIPTKVTLPSSTSLIFDTTQRAFQIHIINYNT